nr:phosphoribosylanthranilate isomerase [Lachnospiraceae bacterium]
APIEMIFSCLSLVKLDAIQLHGDEGNSYIKELRQRLALHFPEKKHLIIKAFQISEQEELYAAALSASDLILLDSGSGGSGECFDWELVRDLKRPFFLAGGIHAGNAARAIRLTRPYGLDVSSGLESGGKKDPEKIRDFMKIIRSIT